VLDELFVYDLGFAIGQASVFYFF